MADTGLKEHHYKLQTVSGYFLQDDPNTNPSEFEYTRSNFGLIERGYDINQLTQIDTVRSERNDVRGNSHGLSGDHNKTLWQRFYHHLDHLNDQAPKNVSYRLVFLARHGQGYHNVAESFYGTEAWDCYYSTLDGNDKITWSDAHLTELGISQAQTAHDFWLKQIQTQNMTLPQSYYVSPLDRAIHTAAITFRDLSNERDSVGDQADDTTTTTTTSPFSFSSTENKPTYPTLQVRELARETIGIHTCDRRSSIPSIQARFPHLPLSFPPDFSVSDPIWLPDQREPDEMHDSRTSKLWDSIIDTDPSRVISVTSHTGAIASFLRVCGHRVFVLQTGGIIPVLLRTEKIAGRRAEGDTGEWMGKPDCGEVVKRRIEVDRESGRDGLGEMRVKGVVD